MRSKIKNFLEQRFLSKWLILFVDATIATTTFFFTYLLRFNLFSEYADVPTMLLQFVAGLPFFILAAVIFKPHRGVIRHSNSHDFALLLAAHLLFSGGYFIISYLGHYWNEQLLIPWSVIIIHYVLSVSIMIFFRFAVRNVYRQLNHEPKDTMNIMIYGAGVLGNIAQTVISKDTNIHYNIVGYIDENPALWGKRIGKYLVFSPEKAFSEVIKNLKVRQVILAISPARLPIENKRNIIELCLESHLKVKEVSDPSNLFNGKTAEGQIREVRIEDLLGRDPISLKVEAVAKGIEGKRVMVTGGAGSIGSEIVRQLVYLQPQTIIIVDQAESALFDIQHEILSLLNETKLLVFVADVTDKFKMRKIFECCYPQIIYHAAAYKHVPMMELQPYEAISNNVGGTKNLADLAVKFEVEKFVMVSTDKAVNPTNIMGATKRVCEIYIQALSQQHEMKTQYITTRFGNVLGSNGSVIPLFKKQIAQGGPVTLTHKDIIRYFMTIPEACQLVMEAGFMGKGGEIYIFDMGQPIRIYDLAVRMISLSGYIPHQEIEIREVGLRPGEKLFEELLADKEETIATTHKKIMIGKIRPHNYKESKAKINELLKNLEKENDWLIVTHLKEIVPEFVSNNSKYEDLDLKPTDLQVG